MIGYTLCCHRLSTEINTKSPGSNKASLSEKLPDSAAATGGSGEKEVGKGKGKSKGKGGARDSDADDNQDIQAPKLSLTPSRLSSSSSGLAPQAIAMTMGSVSMDIGGVSITSVKEEKGLVPKDILAVPMDMNSVPMDMDNIPMDMDNVPMDVGMEVAIDSRRDESLPLHKLLTPISREIPTTTTTSNPGPSSQSVQLPVAVKQEEPNPELLEAVVHFCRETLGREVVGLRDIRNRLLLKQGSVETGHPLREQGVSDTQLESGLKLCGAVEVGQPLGVRLFALPHDDQVILWFRTNIPRVLKIHNNIRTLFSYTCMLIAVHMQLLVIKPLHGRVSVLGSVSYYYSAEILSWRCSRSIDI